MKSLIRAARVYKAVMPTFDPMLEVAEAHQFVECLPSQPASIGFVNVPSTDALMQPFVGGYALAVRIDTKTVPSDVLAAKVKEMVEATEQREGRKPGKKERAELKSEARHTLLLTTLPRTKVLIAFYLPEQQYLIFPTTSSGTSDVAISFLVNSIGSLKTSTIWVSSVKQGLTTRLKSWLEAEEDERGGLFDVFEPGSEVALARSVGEGAKNRMVLKLNALDNAQGGLLEAVTTGFQVESMQLYHGAAHTSFTLSNKFVLTGIDGKGLTKAEERDLEPVVAWQQQAALETLSVATIIDELCKLFDYVPKLEEDPAPEDGDAAQPTGDQAE